jgi:UDP-N-acetylglucosamine--dolichyl-phosphate N-acetylglucosaminephosphotransferase
VWDPQDSWAQRTVGICAGVSVLGFWLTVKTIPVVMTYTLRKGLFGYDINKRGTPQGQQPVYVG